MDRLQQDPSGGAPRDPHWAELSALVTRAEANRVEMSRLQAERAEVCADALDLVALRVAQRQAARGPARGGGRGEIGDTIPLREVMAELSAALRVGERTVSSWLGDGAALVSTYPATLDALRKGRIDDRHASAIIDGGMPLNPERRAEYESLVLPLAETETAASVRESARTIAARLQPDVVDTRHQEALAARQVKTYALQDGLARLLLDAPAVLVQGIFARITDMAAALDAPGDGEVDGADASASGDPDGDDDERTLDQRRADVACDLLLSAAPTAHGDGDLGAIRATVQVTVPLLTLAGLDDTPATLDGHGPIDPGTARILAATAPCWERVMTHPITEEPLRIDTYRPSNRLRRLLNARDRHCRWPGCRRPARRCDADHTVAFSEGGTTCADNLGLLCRRHHRLKHASPWHVQQLGGGTLEFTSPTGRRYRSNAPPVAEAVAAATAGPPWRRLLDAAYDPADPAGF